MRIFIDTSAFYALLDKSDLNYSRAARFFISILEKDLSLCTSNYILVETIALIQHRLGIKALQAFIENILPLVEILWVDSVTHQQAVEKLLKLKRRKLSLVDITSFVIMRTYRIKQVFCFDKHFREQGFVVLP